MTLRVIREPSVSATTLGVVFINDRFFGFSLEDEIREVVGQPVSTWKIPGVTAIPAGRYAIAMTYSAKFRRVMPELVEVPGFTGIRIHAGNDAAATEGCLLFGIQRAGVRIAESAAAVAAVESQIVAARSAGDRVFIAIENPLGH